MGFSKWREEKKDQKIANMQAKAEEMVNGLVAQLTPGEEFRYVLPIVATMRGQTPYSGALALTTYRLIFRGNFLNQWLVDSHPLDRTTGISFKDGALLSKLYIKSDVNSVEYDCNPAQLADLINHLNQAAPISAAPPPNAPLQGSATTDLERLAELHSKGLLSDQEFTLAKQRIIDKL